MFKTEEHVGAEKNGSWEVGSWREELDEDLHGRPHCQRTAPTAAHIFKAEEHIGAEKTQKRMYDQIRELNNVK